MVVEPLICALTETTNKNASKQAVPGKGSPRSASESPPAKPEKTPDLATKATSGDQGLMPHSTTTRSSVTEGFVKKIVDDAVSWAEEKFEKLSVEQGQGVGPYASPATCAPSDLDPIASGVLPAMPGHNVCKDATGKGSGKYNNKGRDGMEEKGNGK
ncbi:uncharacterized protein BDR25DRAFT_338554 [Lindgomyces ingoldianus]|uniref:Uncharacterized protein n=1 Tax=Lindgomyces ingoldianus TaxID=673940 RepID=A0ACB6RHL0_9PLEO|nr:uncharacterized protein BDR25DRAFT_338554 [Lindgomyces ingoldianus]KAF2477815.1 hypothetical protein BDR25DRAFT_338554 [Lindgomyces ingoldianus]